MHSFRHRTLSLLLVLGSFISMASAAPDTDPDDAVRVASGLSRIGVLDKESKSRFIERVTPEYRRLAATEVMAQMLAGDAWQSMTPAQRTELAGLYEKVVLGALYGAIAAAAPAQPGMTGGKMYRSRSELMNRRCDLLQKVDCAFYVADATAGDVAFQHTLMETGKGWALVDVSINKLSLHTAYAPQVKQSLEHGAANMLEKLRGLVSR